MGQGASAVGDAELRQNGSTKQRNAKHRRSTRSLPDAALVRATPGANYPNGRIPNGHCETNVPNSISSSSMSAHQQYQHQQQQLMSRRAGGTSTSNGGLGHTITALGANSTISCVPPVLSDPNGGRHDQEAMMKKYMHRDAAPYYVSTKTKTSCGPRSLDISTGRPYMDASSSQKYKASNSRTRYDQAAAGSSNWSDVASDMFRISRHHHEDNGGGSDRISDVQSDFVSPNDRHAHRQNRASSRRCQQKKTRRSDKHHPDDEQSQMMMMSTNDRRPSRLESGEPDGQPVGRLHYRDCSGLMMTPVPENPHKERMESSSSRTPKDVIDDTDERSERRHGSISTKRSKSVHDCTSSTKRGGQLQPPSHPPPRPPKGKPHYYARLESDASPANRSIGLVEHWIDASPNRSASTDTPTPRSPGSSECDKLVIQSLRAELSAERSLRVDAERRFKSQDKDAETNRQRMRQLETDVQKLTESLGELKHQRDEEAASSKKKLDELTEKCRQMGDDLRRTMEEKRQAEMRSAQEKTSYEEYMDNVANQVGQALARQETMKTECARLQKRVLEVEWENKVLKAQLRLTPMMVSNNSANGMPTNGNCYSTIPSSTASTAASSIIAGKIEFNRYAHTNGVDLQNNNNNGNQAAGIVYRKKSFREKMSGLHRYRQSMGSDPTLDQSGGMENGDDAMPIMSIESLASFTEENEQFDSYDDSAAVTGAQLSTNGRRPYQQDAYLMFNGGEGMCSRPNSFNFDAAAALSARSAQPQTNGNSSSVARNRFVNGDPSAAAAFGGGGAQSYNKMYDSNSQDDEDDDEPVKNYAAMFGEEGLLSSSMPPIAPLLPPSASGVSTIMSTPIFRAESAGDQGTLGRGSNRPTTTENNDDTSSTETLNGAAAGGSNLQANGGGFFADSPKRKLDVVVNMLTSIEMRQPFISPRLWPSEKTTQDTKKMELFRYGYPNAAGLFRDDGYSTMSSELYGVFDSSLLSRLKSPKNTTALPSMANNSKSDTSRSSGTPRLRRSLSDGQLEERHRIEQRILKGNQPSLNLDTIERDYATLLLASADGEEDSDEFIGEHDLSNREALCDDFDIGTCIPPLTIDEKYLLTLNPSRIVAESKTINTGGSTEQLPPDPQSTPRASSPARKPPSQLPRPTEKPRLPIRKPTRSAKPARSDDSTSSDESDGGSGTVIEVARPARRMSKLANASTSSTSTSFTSDDEDDSRFYIDDGAKATMQLWLKQLKIKRAGQKSGLVRYMPPDCRPSILRPGVFARFGTDERRALASFDFLHHAEQQLQQQLEQRQRSLSTARRKGKSRSITDLYENLPYHERAGTLKTQLATATVQFNRSRCSSQLSVNGCGSLNTLTSAPDRGGLIAGRSYCSSLFLSDFCNEDGNCSSDTSNSSLSFTFQ